MHRLPDGSRGQGRQVISKLEYESDTERAVCKAALEELGVLNVKIKGAAGWPDREFFIEGGHPVLVEFKRAGEPPRKLQEYVHGLLRRRGYVVEVHDDYETAMVSLRAHCDKARSVL